MLDVAQNNMANSILVTDTTCNTMFFETTPYASPNTPSPARVRVLRRRCRSRKTTHTASTQQTLQTGTKNLIYTNNLVTL